MGRAEVKVELRTKLRSRRKSISRINFNKWSKQIRQKLRKQEEFRAAAVFHCYVSINERREVDTHPLIKEVLAEGQRVVVPRTNFNEQKLSHFSLQSFDHLQLSKWCGLEPTGGKQISEKELELVIVPMVGADEDGYRIGYGGGFYDRFLSETHCPSIGLCFEQNVVPELPVEPFDIPLNKIITEKRIIHRSGE